MTVIGIFTFALTILLFSITPGPGVLAIMARALHTGFNSSIGLIIGMAVMDVVYLVAVCLGLSVIAEHWHGLFTAIKVFGALYLFYLAYRLWNSKIEQVDDKNVAAPPKKITTGFIEGALISGSNPKVMLFYIGFLPNLIDINALTATDIYLLAMVCFFALVVGLFSIAAIAGNARKWLKEGSHARGINRISAGVMSFAGVWLLTRLQS